jgi:predicted nucleic acid-binding protein
VSEDSGATAPPYIVDLSVAVAVARFDASVMTLIQGYDARGQSLVLPVPALTGASLDVRTEDAEDLLEGLERLENAEVAPLRDAEQAVRLAAVMARTGLDPWDAHVAAVADAAVCPILTLDAPKWRQHSGDLDEPLHIIEVADPDEPAHVSLWLAERR